MALPTYKTRGIMYADLPRVEAASLKESAKMFGAINKRLDQLSSFIEREGTAAAKEQAIKYAAQNPVTQEQINTAMSGQGEARSWLSALTGGNVYDETLAAAQGSLLANKLEIEATTRLNQLKVMADAGKIDFDEAQLEIQDMIDGYTATISAFNPQAASKSRARMATDGNRVIDAIATKRANVIFEANKALFEDGLKATQEAIEDEYFRGDTSDPETGTFTTAEQRSEVKRQTLLENAISSLQEGRVPAVIDMANKARINGVAKGVLSPEFASTWSAAYRKMTTGNMGKYQSSWDAMNEDERKEVKTLVYNEISKLEKFEKEEKTQKQAALRDEEVDIWNAAATATTQEERNALWERTGEMNREYGSELFTPNEREKIRLGDFKKTMDNADLIFELESAIDDEEITVDQIRVLKNEGHILPEQASDLRNRLKRVQEKSVKFQLKQLGSVVEETTSPYASSSVKKKKKAAVTNEAINRIKDGEDPVEVKKDIESRLRQGTDTKRVESIVNGLKKSLTENELRPMLETAVRRQMEAEAKARAEDEFAVSGVTDDTGVLRKFGAPGLGLGPREEAVTVTEQDILDDVVIDNLIDAMIENPTLIDRWIKDKAKATQFKQKLQSLRELGY